MIYSRQDFDNIQSHAASETSTSSTSHTSQSQSERVDEGGRSNNQADSSYDWQPRDEREERQKAPSRAERPAPLRSGDDQTITQRGRSRSREDRSPRQRQRGERSNRDTAQPPEGVTSPREQELQRLRSAESQGGDQPERGISISAQRSVVNERGTSSQDRGEHTSGSNRRRSSYNNSESVTPNDTNHCQQRHVRPDTSTGTSSRNRYIPEHHDRAPPMTSDVPPAM